MVLKDVKGAKPVDPQLSQLTSPSAFELLDLGELDTFLSPTPFLSFLALAAALLAESQQGNSDESKSEVSAKSIFSGSSMIYYRKIIMLLH